MSEHADPQRECRTDRIEMEGETTKKELRKVFKFRVLNPRCPATKRYVVKDEKIK